MKPLALILAASFLFLLALIASVGALYDSAVFLSLSTLMVRILPDGWLSLVMGVLALIGYGTATILTMVLFGYSFDKGRTWVFEGEQGTVRVSLHAIEEFILRKCRALPELRDCTIKTEVDDDGLHLSAKIILELQRSVPEFQQDFQQMLHHELHETLGLPSVGSIQIFIHKILPTDPDAEEKTIVNISKGSKEAKKKSKVLQAK